MRGLRAGLGLMGKVFAGVWILWEVHGKWKRGQELEGVYEVVCMRMERNCGIVWE